MPKTMRRCGETMQYNKKHCPAIIGIYYYVDGIKSPTEIGRILGISTSTVHMVLKRKYGASSPKEIKGTDEIIDAIEAEYLAGSSTYTLAEKYGVHHGTVTKWMAKRGHVRGKGYVPKERLDKNAEAREASAAIRKERMLERKRERDAILQQQRAEREAEKEKRRLEREAEYAKKKHCASCGAVFHSEYKTKMYCSDTCARREKRHRNVALGKTKLHDYSNHRKRARFYGVPYEPGITIEKLMVRDNGICQICGQPCDVDDLRWGYSGPMYPSIDHIIAMANGGPHTWGNVQLAHVICNSFKRDLTDEEMAEEVRRHAEKQTA